ncbi:MAG: hypothetical protein MJZ25_03545 [Fibrobacter sp.]|nr:hypothetical protein [Fibrobacter sp.]
MIYETNTFEQDLVNELTAALSFTFESDTEVGISDNSTLLAVLSTKQCRVNGEFIAACGLFGTFDAKYTVKDGQCTIPSVDIAINGNNPYKCDLSSQARFIKTVKEMHQLYLTRQAGLKRQQETLQQLCDKIDSLAELVNDANIKDNIIKITQEIRTYVG